MMHANQKYVNSPAYKSWKEMKYRCGRLKHYLDVSYAPEWETFEGFYKDMGDRPEGCSLDRIDCNGDYTPENCRWATWEEQENNRSNNRYYIWNGEKLTLSQIARKEELNRNSLATRIYKYHDTIQDAVARVAMVKAKRRVG
jgi:hypothetical protein